jgi:Phage integrase, N-terminal SAM-like domain
LLLTANSIAAWPTESNKKARISTKCAHLPDLPPNSTTKLVFINRKEHVSFTSTTSSFKQARQTCRLKHFSPKTEKIYLHYIQTFIMLHNEQQPKDMDVAEIEAFLNHLAVRKRVIASCTTFVQPNQSRIAFVNAHVNGWGLIPNLLVIATDQISPSPLKKAIVLAVKPPLLLRVPGLAAFDNRIEDDQ